MRNIKKHIFYTVLLCLSNFSFSLNGKISSIAGATYHPLLFFFGDTHEKTDINIKQRSASTERRKKFFEKFKSRKETEEEE